MPVGLHSVPAELELVPVEQEPDLLLVVELVLVLVELAPAMALVLVLELLAMLAVWWLSPMEQLSQLRSQLLLVRELNILLLLLPARVNFMLLLLPARVNLKVQAENILHVVCSLAHSSLAVLIYDDGCGH